MLISGAAAGMAAVFRAPLTGLIFALEMPYKDDLAHEALLPSLIASVVSYAVLVAFMGTAPLFAFGGTAPFSDKDLLWSALLAAKNFAGPAEPLTGAQGYYHALDETPDIARLTAGLGATWTILATSYKPYPCGFVMHPAIDCVLGWRRENPKAQVDEVVVTGNPLMAARADRPNISTGRESQVSVQHAVAAALTFGKAGLEQFTDACVNDPAVRALRGKVEVLRDEKYPTIAAAVEITTTNGETHHLVQHAARGSDTNPMSDRDLEEKLRDAALSWNPRHDVAPLIDAIWQVDKSADVSQLAAMTVPHG